ncbi:MAG: 5-formyltetrahydrofolate cyclo-ligase [Bradymonadia bacterium]|jgi:5-formyltetrahydrofolate cyclo-ligase
MSLPERAMRAHGLTDVDPASLRARLRAARRAVVGLEREAAERQIAATVCAHPWFAEANRVLAYRAFDGEVGVGAIVQRALDAGKQVLFARALPDAPLSFVVPWRWRTSNAGCPVPEGPAADFSPHDLMLVPGVGFTLDGHRIGLGGGHYDRTLARRPVRSVGIAFACQLVTEVPLRAWDMPVRSVVTTQGWHADPACDRSPVD